MFALSRERCTKSVKDSLMKTVQDIVGADVEVQSPVFHCVLHLGLPVDRTRSSQRNGSLLIEKENAFVPSPFVLRTKSKNYQVNLTLFDLDYYSR